MYVLLCRIIELTPVKPQKYSTSSPPPPAGEMYQIYRDASEGGQDTDKKEEVVEVKVKEEAEGDAVTSVQEDSSGEAGEHAHGSADVGGGLAASQVDETTGEQLMVAEMKTGGGQDEEVESNKCEEGGSMEVLEQGKSQGESLKGGTVLSDQEKETDKQMSRAEQKQAGIGPQLSGEGANEGVVDCRVIGRQRHLSGGGEAVGDVPMEGTERDVMDEDDTPGLVLSEGDVKRIVNILEELKKALEHSRHTTVSRDT